MTELRQFRQFGRFRQSGQFRQFGGLRAMSARRYRIAIEVPKGGATLTDAIRTLQALGFRIVTAETDHPPSRSERAAIGEAVEGAETWDTAFVRYLEDHWNMDRHEVTRVLLRCIEDPTTRQEFVRLAEEWM